MPVGKNVVFEFFSVSILVVIPSVQVFVQIFKHCAWFFHIIIEKETLWESERDIK